MIFVFENNIYVYNLTSLMTEWVQFLATIREVLGSILDLNAETLRKYSRGGYDLGSLVQFIFKNLLGTLFLYYQSHHCCIAPHGRPRTSRLCFILDLELGLRPVS